MMSAKTNKMALVLTTLLLASCGGGSASSLSNASQETGSSDVLTSIASDYKTAFSITADSTSGASISYDETANVYTLAVCAEKAEYTVVGYKVTNIVVKDVSGLGNDNYKGVKITFNKAAIVSANSSPAIDYTLTQKNVQISIKNGTNNVIYCNGSGDAVYSSNNIEVTGKGSLSITTASGHGMKAEGDITFQGSNSLTVVSGHDGLHCEHLITTDEDSLEAYSGTVTIASAVSQGIEATTSKGKGTISIDGGKWNVNNAESVFKTDSSLYVGAGASVIADGITDDAIVFGDNASTDMAVTIDGTFKVNGTSLASMTLTK